MKRFCSLLFLLASPLVLAAEADLEARGAYVRALPPSVRNTSAYMTLVNESGAELVLTGGSSPAAQSVMLHETTSENGQMRMRHVMAASIPPGGELVLQPGGMHLMLSGLKSPLAAGDSVEVVLRFRGGLERSLRLPVRSLTE